MILAHHLLLDYALICTHFGRFWMSFIMEFVCCVQQFWACKFMVSLCLLLLVQRSEEKWGEERWGDKRRVGGYFGVTLWWSLIGWYFGHLVAECECIEFNYNGDGADVRSWVTAVLSSEVLVWLMTKLLRVLVCRRIDDCSGLPYYIPRNCVVSTSDSVQW